MFQKLTKLIAIIVVGLLFILKPQATEASTNFTTDYHVVYTVDEKGITHSNLSITLKNTTAQFYASSYQLQLGFDDIANVKASDPQGPVKTAISKTDNGYNVALTFNKKSVGLGSKLPFTLSFDSKSIAQHAGKIWEINIPGIANPTEFADFTVDVKPPASFGKATIIKPQQPNNKLTFSKEQLGKSGISIAFGERQVYSYSLIYHLRNSNLYPTKTEIALPPDTNYQKVYISDISPRPENVKVDADGNWLAQYSLSPSETKEVKVKGSVAIQLDPEKSELSKDLLAQYTSPTKYWQSKDGQIKKIAQDLKTPDEIYNYVVKTLKYDFRRLTDSKVRLGAANALKNPNSAVCREFTDLFIALSRAKGIPAREVNGYAYTENQKQRPMSLVEDVLHAWPEYYDLQRKAWIMVDPTWGATTGGVDYFSTLDFDHFAFVVKGMDDNYPIPAGGYKLDNGVNKKDIAVSFTTSPIDDKQHIDMKSSISNPQVAGFPIKAKITLSNLGPAAISDQVMRISATNLAPKDQALQVSVVPPFGSVNFDIDFDKTSFLTNNNVQFTIHFGEKTTKQDFKVVPFFLTPLGLGGVALGLLTTIILIVAYKSRRVRLH